MTTASVPNQVGQYEIRHEIGRGGMGVVYLAHDSRLDRDVENKRLPEELLENRDRLDRFEREAKLLASLNHANIAGVHELEEMDGVHYLILEYVDGEDLSDRLAAGALPVDETLHIAKQIARAVEAAHARGVIHRDLKPGNVKVTVDGDVKVLDFGLAKAFEDPTSMATAVPDSRTVVQTESPTVAGVVLGTAGYMSPEQARGKPIDKRSDIWSFGCILYEMLTGACPFPGESVAESLGATIHKEPDWSALPERVPPNVQLLLHRCLQKDRSRRLQDIGDARVELDDTLSGSTQIWTGGVSIPTPVPRSKWRSAPWVLAMLVPLTLAIGFGVAYARLAGERPAVVRASVPPPADTMFLPAGDLAGPVVVSHNGRMLAFAATGDDGQQRLWVRSLAETTASVLPGTEGGTFPFWSQDDRAVAFFADDLLKRVGLVGGTPITICLALNGRGGTWNRDGVILFAPNAVGPIHRVAATGGASAPVTTMDRSRHTSHRWPSFLPDGRHFLYSAIHHEGTRAQENAIFFASLDGATNREVMRSAVNGQYAAGHLLSVLQGTLMATRFDAGTGRLHGDPRPLATGVAYSLGTWNAAFSCSPAGVIAYHCGALVQGEGARITWYDRSGQELRSVSQVTGNSSLRLSPDGKRLAFVSDEASSSIDLWIYDTERELPMRLTFMPGWETSAVWSADGSELMFGFAYRTGGDSPAGIYRAPVGGGAPQLVLEQPQDGSHLWPLDWSPDGRYLIFGRGQAVTRTAGDLLVLPVDPPGDPVVLVGTTSFNEDWARFSPDGRWIAYNSTESGRNEVYVIPWDPETGHAGPGKWQISNGGGRLPKWSVDGSELFYVSDDDMLVAVKVDVDGDRFRPGVNEPLFALRVVVGNNFDVDPQGRFVLTSPDEQSDRPIELILNWTSELDR